MSCSDQQVKFDTEIPKEEYTFYSAFLENLVIDSISTIKDSLKPKLVINDFTIGYSDSILLNSALEGMNIIDKSIYFDFVKKNQKSYSLIKIGNHYTNCIILDYKTRNEINKEKRTKWDNLFDFYPNAGGILTLSRVGFSKDNAIAVIRVDLELGDTWGEKIYLSYIKRNNKWMIKSKFVLHWVN